jgi:hypothetical protein
MVSRSLCNTNPALELSRRRAAVVEYEDNVGVRDAGKRRR